jgi:hypothetical protein
MEVWHVCFWHKCEVPTGSSNVRVRRQSGRHLLWMSISHFDSSATLGEILRACNAHSLSFESAQGEFVRENFEAGKRSSKLRSEREPEKADYPATDLDLRAAQAGAIHHDQF